LHRLLQSFKQKKYASTDKDDKPHDKRADTRRAVVEKAE
jgi:hypothetical protein